jgi:hypothetical protein
VRIKLRWIVGPLLGLLLGSLCAEPYARIAAPYYLDVAQWIASTHPWVLDGISVVRASSGPGYILKLTGTVSEFAGGPPAAMLIGKLQVAAVAESPAIFWTLLLVWPVATWRQRLSIVVLGIPLFLALEAATTLCQLLNPFAFASAVLAGAANPVTIWERWSRFLEGGGRVALAIAAALVPIALTQLRTMHRRPRGEETTARPSEV